MKERTFEDLGTAKLIFEARVARAKSALRIDLEIIESTKIEGGGGHPAMAAAQAATEEYSRALRAAFAEYLELTTNEVPDDPEERERFSREHLAAREAELERAGGGGLRG